MWIAIIRSCNRLVYNITMESKQQPHKNPTKYLNTYTLHQASQQMDKAFDNSNVWCNGSIVYEGIEIVIDGRMKLCTNI